MAESRPDPVTFERALKRENARQKRHRQGGQLQQLSRRLEEHDRLPRETVFLETPPMPTPTPAPPKKKKKKTAAAMPSPAPPPPPPTTTYELLTDTTEVLFSPAQVPTATITIDDNALLPSPSPSPPPPTPQTSPVPDSLEELLAQLPPPSPEPDFFCPFHPLELMSYHVSGQGWNYVKCSHDPCVIFVDAQKAPEFLTQVERQRHPHLIAGNGTAQDPNPPLICFCGQPLALRCSQTVKNPGRLFLACKTQSCRFFQWLNEPWLPRLRQSWARANRPVQVKLDWAPPNPNPFGFQQEQWAPQGWAAPLPDPWAATRPNNNNNLL